MSPAGYVLIVDDEIDIIDTYREVLAEDGVVCESARTAEEASAALAKPGVAVVVLDQRLRGRDDGNSGLDLLRVARSKAPHAKVIVVTGYADADAARRAFADGAWDYLQKGAAVTEILRVKVRNAMEVWSERTLAALSREAREKELADTWHRVRTEADRHRKGALLETLLKLLFRSIPGFENATTNRQNELEEIDVVVQNNSADPLWQKEGSYLLVECKHWSEAVGVDQLVVFQDKVERRFGRASLGFFVAMGGYTATAKAHEWSRRTEKSLVVLLTADDIDSLVKAADRNARLKELHLRAIVA